MFFKFAGVAILAASLIGCASVSTGDAKRDAHLKTFSAKPEVVGIYVYRNGFAGPVMSMDVKIDGKALGETPVYTYLYTEVAPGKHTISSKARSDYLPFKLDVETVAGKNYYIWNELLWGAKAKLHLVSEEEGQKGVKETRLVKSKE